MPKAECEEHDRSIGEDHSLIRQTWLGREILAMMDSRLTCLSDPPFLAFGPPTAFARVDGVDISRWCPWQKHLNEIYTHVIERVAAQLICQLPITIRAFAPYQPTGTFKQVRRNGMALTIEPMTRSLISVVVGYMK